MADQKTTSIREKAVGEEFEHFLIVQMSMVQKMDFDYLLRQCGPLQAWCVANKSLERYPPVFWNRVKHYWVYVHVDQEDIVIYTKMINIYLEELGMGSIYQPPKEEMVQ